MVVHDQMTSYPTRQLSMQHAVETEPKQTEQCFKNEQSERERYPAKPSERHCSHESLENRRESINNKKNKFREGEEIWANEACRRKINKWAIGNETD